MDVDVNSTDFLSTNTSESYDGTTEEDSVQSLAESYMIFKIGLSFQYVWNSINIWVSPR